MALRRIAVDPVSPVLCKQVLDKALNRNALEHGDAENAVTALTTNFVRQVVKNGGIRGLRPCGAIRQPLRRCLRAGVLAAALPETLKVGQDAVFAAGVFRPTAVFIHHD